MPTRAERTPRRRSVARVVVPAVVATVVLGLVVASVTAFTLILPAARARAVAVATTPGTCPATSVQVVAHPDDDLLFMNPDVIHDIEAGRCVRTVYLTTGDANHDESYWLLREDGIRAAYATMAGAEDAWTERTLHVADRRLATVALDAAPGIELVFLRLPDGDRRGTGFPLHDHQSLARLWLGEIDRIDAVDGSASYDRAALLATIAALVDDVDADLVRTQDWTLEFRTGDSADHTAGALFARAGAARSDAAPRLVAYAGYPSWTQPANVSGRDLALKAKAILAYAAHDPKMCVQLRCVESLVTALRAGRQYVVVQEEPSAHRHGAQRAAMERDRAVTGALHQRAAE